MKPILIRSAAWLADASNAAIPAALIAVKTLDLMALPLGLFDKF
jgi:hypothetical protein